MSEAATTTLSSKGQVVIPFSDAPRRICHAVPMAPHLPVILPRVAQHLGAPPGAAAEGDQLVGDRRLTPVADASC
jgi:hypothetical protein